MDLDHLNPSQRRAVLATEGPVLVLAGAGSGKTRVITHRVAHLLELGVPADRIVALSFTNKAADEMRHRLARMVGSRTAGELVLATFHSLGASLLRNDPEAFGLPGARFSILDQGDVFGIVRGLVREHGHHGKDERRYDIAGLVQRISLWKNAFVATHAVEKEVVDEYDVVAAAIYEPYEDRLRTLGAVDFDDLVCLVARRLQDDEALRERIRERFSYVMVDEYQDTNDAQVELLRQLVPAPYNLCVVGDDDQAIYGWRGAKVENILEFEQRFPGTCVVKLEENYRSRGKILQCANAVVRNNQKRHEKTLVATRSEGVPVTLVVASDGPSEAAWVGKQIRRLVHDEGVSPGEIAVLYRNALQARLVEEELQQHGLRYRVLGGQSMYDKKEIKDALAYLKALVSPRDELAVRRALETPPRGIGRQTMEHLTAHAARERVSLLEAVHRHPEIEGLTPRAIEGLRQFSELLRAAQAKARECNDVAIALAFTLDQAQLREHVRRETGSDQATEYRMASVTWLLESVTRFEQRARDRGKPPRWSDYFNAFQQDRNTEASAEEGNARDRPVTLATLHSAKGLEWEHVFILGAEEGTMPHRRVASPRKSDAISGDIEEERRLFYVGITRARECLWITRAAGRSDRGRSTARAPSRFLLELPPEATQTYDIAVEEELSSEAMSSMADAFLASIRPPDA